MGKYLSSMCQALGWFLSTETKQNKTNETPPPPKGCVLYNPSPKVLSKVSFIHPFIHSFTCCLFFVVRVSYACADMGA